MRDTTLKGNHRWGGDRGVECKNECMSVLEDPLLALLLNVARRKSFCRCASDSAEILEARLDVIDSKFPWESKTEVAMGR